MPASFFETYSAMANTDGGTIVLGAAERDDGSFDVRGVAEAGRVEQDLWNQLDNRQKVSANVLQRANVQRALADGGEVLAISVPRADRRARPVYLNGNPPLAYRRSREGDRRCSEAEVRRMLADASDEPADAILEGFGPADLDRSTLDAWRNLFRARQPDHPFLAGDEVALLTSVGAWRRHRTSGREGLTVAGLLMFGTERPILDYFPRYQLDYRECAMRCKLLTLLVFSPTGCGSQGTPCSFPLEDSCRQCAGFEPAFRDVTDGADAPRESGASRLGTTTTVLKCGAFKVIWTQSAHGAEGRYYVTDSGELSGVRVEADTSFECDGGPFARSSTAAHFGAVPNCELECILFEDCTDSGLCAFSLPRCDV